MIDKNKIKHTANQNHNLKCWCGALLVRHLALVVKTNRKRYFWGCTRYPICNIQIPDKNGTPHFGKRIFRKLVRINNNDAV